jgi:membrane protein
MMKTGNWIPAGHSFWKEKMLKQLRLFFAALSKFDHDHGFFLSSAITFNLLICLIPIILSILALLGTYLYGSKEVLNHIRQYLQSVVPSTDPKLMRDVLRIIQDRRIVGVVGIAGLLWTSTWVFSSIRTAFTTVFREESGRNIIHGKAIDLFMILLAGLFLLVSMTFSSVMTYVQASHVAPFLKPLIRFFLKYLVPFFFSFWMFFLIYKIVPNRKIPWKPALQAACFSSLLWEAAKQLFGWYVTHLGKFSMVYGSLSTMAVLFLWIYYSSAILILGGEIAFLLDMRGKKIRRTV